MINRVQAHEPTSAGVCPTCGAAFASRWFPDGYSPSAGALCANGLLDPPPDRAAATLRTCGQEPEQPLGRALASLSARLGPPSQYSGDSCGPAVQWRWPSQTVILTAPRGLCPQVTVSWTSELEQAESAAFGRAAGAPPGPHGTAPYLWRYQPGPACLPAPPALVAPSWDHLQSALQAVLRAWCSHLVPLVGSEGAGFNIVVRDRRWRLCVIVSPEDQLLLAVDDRGLRDGQACALGMRQRGWQTFVPLLRIWDAQFALSDDGAESAARLVVAELQHRNVRSPGDLRLTHISSGDQGQLDLPGLSIPPAEHADIAPRAIAS